MLNTCANTDLRFLCLSLFPLLHSIHHTSKPVLSNSMMHPLAFPLLDLLGHLFLTAYPGLLMQAVCSAALSLEPLHRNILLPA